MSKIMDWLDTPVFGKPSEKAKELKELALEEAMIGEFKKRITGSTIAAEEKKFYEAVNKLRLDAIESETRVVNHIMGVTTPTPYKDPQAGPSIIQPTISQFIISAITDLAHKLRAIQPLNWTIDPGDTIELSITSPNGKYKVRSSMWIAEAMNQMNQDQRQQSNVMKSGTAIHAKFTEQAKDQYIGESWTDAEREAGKKREARRILDAVKPTVGRIVHVKLHNKSDGNHVFVPAIVQCVNSDGSLTLCVFYQGDPGMQFRVLKGDHVGEWSWPQ